jgi:hypothetical protein
MMYTAFEEEQPQYEKLFNEWNKLFLERQRELDDKQDTHETCQ